MKIKELGAEIRKRRDSLKLKQEDLAEMSGTTSRTLHEIEAGKGNPSLKTMNKIIDVLGLELVLQIKQLG